MSAIDSNEKDHRSVLASVDKTGRRKWLYVAIQKGAWRFRRQLLAVVLIGFYLALPWVTIDGLPLLRIDIPERHYILFGQIFWPQDFFYALLFLLIFLVGTVLLVSLLGRVFCGWLCPHNVFLEMVFRPIEQLCEGPAHRRRINDHKKHPGSGLAMRKAAKWALFILIAGAMANTATALFVGTDAFISGLIIDPVEHPAAAWFFIIFFAINLFNFSWFREQTCTILCPYGRLQSVLLDDESLTVAYDSHRGEDRGKSKKGPPPGHLGDCIDCHRCVDVCPTGIDIRNGNQMECLHCSACIDACNDVMAKMDRAPNLIAYLSEQELAGGKRRWVRPRTVIYGCVLTVLVAVTGWLVLSRPLLDAVPLGIRGTPQVVKSEDNDATAVRQPLRVSLINKTREPRRLHLVPEIGTVISQFPEIELPANDRIEYGYFLEVPVSALSRTRTPIAISVTDEQGTTVTRFTQTVRRPIGASQSTP